jgi:hypothetical protein
MSAFALSLSALSLPSRANTTRPPMMVWKAPTCGYCQLPVGQLEKEGLSVKARYVAQTVPARMRLGIADDRGSCHTGLAASSAIEPHAPAREIKRLLAEPEHFRHQLIGLSMPGTPIGSTGMKARTKRDKLDVLLVPKGNKNHVNQSYPFQT